MTNFGEISGDVTGDKTFKGFCTFYQGISGSGVQVVKDSNIWYVDKNKTSPASSGDGKSWENAFLTVTEAISAAGNYDIIFIGQGVYSEAATLTITQTGLKIFGAGTSGYIWGPTSLKSDTCADHLIKVEANGVEIAGLDFIANTNAKDAIRLATTADIYKTHIHDCHFGASNGEYGVYIGDTYDAVDTHIERCEFNDLVTAGIRLNGTRCKVTNCLFFVPASGIGIEYVPDTGDRPNSAILHNYMMGSSSSDTGIKITNSPTAGTFIIADNYIANCNTSITTGKGDNMMLYNRVSNATGGEIFDPSP